MSAAPVDAVESYLFSGVVKGENKVLGLAVSVYDFHTPQCNNNNIDNLHSLHLAIGGIV